MNTTSGAFPLGAAAKQSSPSISQRPRLRRADPWEAAVGSFREVSASARSARFSALCVSRARGEELATLSSTGDGGTGGSSLGLGDDGATAALDGRPVGWLPLRGATSRAGRTGCCAILRVLVAGGALRGGGGWCWGSVGGLAKLQRQGGLAAFASGASFLSWYLWMGCLLLAGPKFWVPGVFSAATSAPLTQSSPPKTY